MSKKTRYTVEMSDGDRKFVDEFMNSVKMLAGMVKEIVKEEPRNLLSPVMRQMLIDKAREVEGRRFTLSMRHVFVDNPCDDLKFIIEG